jgi:hypothetical protein
LVVVDHTPAPIELPITADLGTAHRFNGSSVAGALAAGATDRYAFIIRDSELRTTSNGATLIGVEVVAAGLNTLQPGLPGMDGLEPRSTHTEAGRAFALFAVDLDGLHLLEIAGADSATAGDYVLNLFIAGDINSDGIVDGSDAQYQSDSLGSSAGDPEYLVDADLDRSGTVNATDLQILNANTGYVVNRPPVLTVTDLTTHIDLTVTADLGGLGTDPEDDSLFYRLDGATNGEVALSPDGRSVIFTPASGISGAASFGLLADDGFAASAPVTIPVNISDAELIALDFATRSIRLEPGQRHQLEILADFADQNGVTVPASFVRLQSTDASVAVVNADGVVTALADGSSVLLAEAASIQAATAVGVGFPTDQTQQFLHALGLVADPEAIALPVSGGTRQFNISVDHQIDLTAGSAGTQYYVSNSSVISVSPDGLVTALDEGFVTLTAINGPAEVVVPIRVEMPRIGSSLVGPDGGVVQGSDGSIIQIAPGALGESASVGIAPIAENDLPMPIPSWLDFAAAFDLDLNDQNLEHPLHFAVPTPGLPVGEKVYVYQAGTVPDPAGGDAPTWLQVEVGTVGTDGLARTNSWPYPGIRGNSGYFIGSANQPVGQIIGDFDSEFGVSAYSQVAVATQISNSLGERVGGYYDADKGFVLDVFAGPIGLDIVPISLLGTPSFSTFNVDVAAGTNNVQVVLTPPPAVPGPTIDQEPTLELGSGSPVIMITGSNFGSQIEALSVNFRVGRSTFTLKGADGEFEFSPSQPDTLEVPVPLTVTLGFAGITVTKIDEDMATGRKVERESNAANMTILGGRSFSALRQGNEIAVFDVNHSDPDFDFTHLDFATIPIVSAIDARPSYVAFANDGTRAYATLSRGNGIAVIDAVALQQIDVDPGTSEVDHISLAGAQPFRIVIDPWDRYAYVTDQIATGGASSVYVIDIRPSSTKYNQRVDTISVAPAEDGLRGLDISKDGERLYLAAPNRTQYTGEPEPGKEKGHILVVDIDPTSSEYRQQVDSIVADDYPFGVRAVSDPSAPNDDVVLFTNFLSEVHGVGVLRNGSVERYISMTLGSPHDSFDVETVRDIVVHPDLTYAYVTGFAYPNTTLASRNHGVGIPYPAGSNVGIIKDPLGLQGDPKLIAATRPIPVGFPDGLDVTEDGRFLFVNYALVQVDAGNPPGAVFIYDLDEMLNQIEESDQQDSRVVDNVETFFLDRHPVNEFVLIGGVGAPFDPDFLPHVGIDIRAAYRVTLARDPGQEGTFEVYDEDHRPLAVGGAPRGIVVQGAICTSPVPLTIGVQDYVMVNDDDEFSMEFANAAIGGSAEY